LFSEALMITIICMLLACKADTFMSQWIQNLKKNCFFLCFWVFGLNLSCYCKS